MPVLGGCWCWRLAEKQAGKQRIHDTYLSMILRCVASERAGLGGAGGYDGGFHE